MNAAQLLEKLRSAQGLPQVSPEEDVATASAPSWIPGIILLAAVSFAGLWWRHRAHAANKKDSQSEMILSNSVVWPEQPNFALASFAGESSEFRKIRFDPVGLKNEIQHGRVVMAATGEVDVWTGRRPLGKDSGFTSKFRVGDKVEAIAPFKISNDGYGYFNEGAGYGCPAKHRDPGEDGWERANLPKVVDGRSQGHIVGMIPIGHWKNRPKHWKGHKRVGIMVSWEEPTYPIDVVDECYLKLVDRTISDEKAEKKREWLAMQDA